MTNNMTVSEFKFTLPDILSKFPWKRNLSEFYKETKVESSAWTESYHLFDDEGLEGFNRCDFSMSILVGHTLTTHRPVIDLLAALSYSPRERGK